MKKHFFIIMVFAVIAHSAKAQLSVYSNGKVGIATSSSTTPVSTFSVKGDKPGYEAAVIGSSRGLYALSQDQYLGWSYGVYGKIPASFGDSDFQCGVMGDAVIASPFHQSRTYGVIGHAGNATNGWNYGVLGELDGTNYGAGIYGTATHAENGTYVDGRYAGYFNGTTKVNGDFIVTGYMGGILLNQISNATNISNLSNAYDKSSITDKFSRLSAIQYFTEPSNGNAKRMEESSDTVSRSVPIEEIQTLSASRVHYGLDVDKLKEAFPELVYEKEDGTTGVNYVEMIPILVQVINNLSDEIKVLKSGGTSPYSERSSSGTSAVILSSDGQVIGTKRAK